MHRTIVSPSVGALMRRGEEFFASIVRADVGIGPYEEVR